MEQSDQAIFDTSESDIPTNDDIANEENISQKSQSPIPTNYAEQGDNSLSELEKTLLDDDKPSTPQNGDRIQSPQNETFHDQEKTETSYPSDDRVEKLLDEGRPETPQDEDGPGTPRDEDRLGTPRDEDRPETPQDQNQERTQTPENDRTIEAPQDDKPESPHDDKPESPRHDKPESPQHGEKGQSNAADFLKNDDENFGDTLDKSFEQNEEFRETVTDVNIAEDRNHTVSFARSISEANSSSSCYPDTTASTLTTEATDSPSSTFPGSSLNTSMNEPTDSPSSDTADTTVESMDISALNLNNTTLDTSDAEAMDTSVPNASATEVMDTSAPISSAVEAMDTSAPETNGSPSVVEVTDTSTSDLSEVSKKDSSTSLASSSSETDKTDRNTKDTATTNVPESDASDSTGANTSFEISSTPTDSQDSPKASSSNQETRESSGTEKDREDKSDDKEKSTQQTSADAEKDKDDQSANNIEYVDLDGGVENHEDTEKDCTQASNSEPERERNGQDKNPLESDGSKTTLPDTDEDPIAADGDDITTENPEGADEELCIIPDTERVISQAEKDAAFSIPPLRDISEASVSTENSESSSPAIPNTTENSTTSSADKYVISKCNKDDLQTCLQCLSKRKAKYDVTKERLARYICGDSCLEKFKSENANGYVLNWEAEIRVKDFTSQIKEQQPKLAYERKCVVCKKKTENEECILTWEIMDFCTEYCLSKYQREIGSVCASCSVEVKPNSLGKYCVRFGNDIRQFCSSHCLEEYKKGLKVCTYCQQDILAGSDGFLAPVGDKGQFKDFCSQKCMEKYDIMTKNRPPKVDPNTKCSVCKTDNTITIEYESNYFCSDRCFVAYSFVNNITPSKCNMCRRYFPNEVLEKNTLFYDNVQYSFCSNSCQNIYIIAHRKIVPCCWCKVKKYNFDMIRRYFKEGPVVNMCSINCLSLFQVSVNAVHSKKTPCDNCNKRHQPMYHLTMSDATIRNFCSYICVMAFQNKYKKTPITLSSEENVPVPAGEPKKNRKFALAEAAACTKPASPPLPGIPLPVISGVQSLASKNGPTFTPPIQNTTTRTVRAKAAPVPQPHMIQTPVELPCKIKHHVIIKPAPVPDQRNVATMCKIRTINKGIQAKATFVDKGMVTDRREADKVLIPVPVPVFIPTPLPMYTVPVPYPLPFPLPIPVPVFIPTTRNSAKGIMKEIKKIQVKIPTDPYEAELLMMAEMVAGDKKEENTDSESDVDDAGGADEGSFSPEPVDASNTFGDDMLQMALKMATELEEPAVDLEGALTANTITAPQGGEGASEDHVDDPQPMLQMSERQGYRGRKRSSRGARTPSNNKRRRMSQPQQIEMPSMAAQAVAPPEPVEKPDAHLCLKYTFGVNAWKQWVTTKNADLEKTTKYAKPFKTEILQLTADELNYSLCLFVKEVRKPNGAEYAPDTIYYLCLGIQQYLFENARIDNIFCDPYYEQFTDSLDEIARKFSVLYNDSHYIVTRVEEEHLWESKQLGAHSPHVLLSTLMFFNTKHFNLTTVQEHMQLSFSHIMKHWKRNPNQAGGGGGGGGGGVARTPGSRNVLLRFYPPQASVQNNTRKKKVYEQQENDENPLRCPVKLYEFYLSKCPESVKTRNDVFYLQPERSCVPDSPVWYSTTALPQEALEKMLHRVKMVKEINVALLTS